MTEVGLQSHRIYTDKLDLTSGRKELSIEVILENAYIEVLEVKDEEM